MSQTRAEVLERIVVELRTLIKLQSDPGEDCFVNYFEVEEQWSVLKEALDDLGPHD